MEELGIQHIDVGLFGVYNNTMNPVQLNYMSDQRNMMSYFGESIFYSAEVNVRGGPNIYTSNEWGFGFVGSITNSCQKCVYDNGLLVYDVHPLRTKMCEAMSRNIEKETNQLCAKHDAGQVPIIHPGTTGQSRTFEMHSFYATHAKVRSEFDGSPLQQLFDTTETLNWLVAIKYGEGRKYSDGIDPQFDTIYILKSFRWTSQVEINLSGHGGVAQVEAYPFVYKVDPTPVGIPYNVLAKPSVMNARSAIFYYKEDESKTWVIMKPKMVVVPWMQWIRDMMPMTKNLPPRAADLVECPLMETLPIGIPIN